MCGLSVEKFNMLYEIVSPYADAIIYPDGKSNDNITEKSTELMTYFTVCRHSLHLGLIFFMLDLGKSSADQISCWMVKANQTSNKVKIV